MYVCTHVHTYDSGARAARRTAAQADGGRACRGAARCGYSKGTQTRVLNKGTQRVLKRGYSTKGTQPRVLNQGYSTKGTQPRVLNRGYSTEGTQPRVLNQGCSTKGTQKGTQPRVLRGARNGYSKGYSQQRRNAFGCLRQSSSEMGGQRSAALCTLGVWLVLATGACVGLESISID